VSTGPAQGPPVATDRPTRSATIVLVGAFNPLILQPQWLADNGVIEEGDLRSVEDSGNAMVSADFTGIEFRSFSVEVTRDRLQVVATDELETPLLLADVVVNVFSLLSHTPVRAAGLNHTAHTPMDSDHRHALLSALAVPGSATDLLQDPSLESARWRSARTDGHDGAVRLTIEPSVLLPDGLFVSLNDHFEFGDRGTGADVAELLASEWQESLQRAEQLFETIVRAG
jgi:hypothetical protein